MKIPLKLAQTGHTSDSAEEARALAREILAAQSGDWDAKNSLLRRFHPLIVSLAQKRTSNQAEVNAYIDSGKEGLVKAVRKYHERVGAEKFRIFALDFIEAGMNRTGKKGGGFFARLFGR
jgi:DNA-directed RNA polymerase specialized sigma subunit